MNNHEKTGEKFQTLCNLPAFVLTNPWICLLACLYTYWNHRTLAEIWRSSCNFFHNFHRSTFKTVHLPSSATFSQQKISSNFFPPNISGIKKPVQPVVSIWYDIYIYIVQGLKNTQTPPPPSHIVSCSICMVLLQLTQSTYLLASGGIFLTPTSRGCLRPFLVPPKKNRGPLSLEPRKQVGAVGPQAKWLSWEVDRLTNRCYLFSSPTTQG